VWEQTSKKTREKMKINKYLKLMLTLSVFTIPLYSSEFEGSHAEEAASSLFLKRHEIMSMLEPIEVLLPRGTFAFTNWYVTSLEEYFHNVVTPILSSLITRNTLEVSGANLDHIYEALESRRTILMEEGYKKAYSVAIKIKMDHAFDERMTEDSLYIGSLLILNHYKPRMLSLPYAANATTFAEAEFTNDSVYSVSEEDES
jgi:hypothetical protein